MRTLTNSTRSIWRSPLVRRCGGFTLLEALVVIFLIAIVATLAAPNLIAWRNKAKIRSAANNLKGDLELAKFKAAQINGQVAIQYTADDYEIFHDSGGLKYIRDSGEQLYRARSLPPGVNIDLEDSSNINFKGKGTARSGSIYLVNSNGLKKRVKVSAVGRIKIEDKPK